VKVVWLVVAALVAGCGARPLGVDDVGAGVGGGEQQPIVGSGGSTAGAGGSGAVVSGAGGGSGEGLAGEGGGGAAGAVETGCAVDPALTEDCDVVDTLSLVQPRLDDYGGDGRVSAGEAAHFSIMLASGDQSFSYPAVGLTDDNPLVTIAPRLPETNLYALTPHQQTEGVFDFLVDPAVAPGTVVHFTACPGRLGRFCRGGPRVSFDLTVQPREPPTWTTAPGRPAGPTSCGIGTSNIDRICAGLDKVTWSNPRAVFFVIGPNMYVSVAAWLTNADVRDHTICVKGLAGDRASSSWYPSVAAGKSTAAGFGGINLGSPLPSGTTIHFTAWTGLSEADCPNGSRIDFDATVP
jgi:hypothetical protein